MAEKKRGREIAFAETYEEAVKKVIEKAFLKQGISYLIKVDKVREMKRGHLESRKKYSFHINRLQTEEAKAALVVQNLDEGSVHYMI
ncbi:MAG: hypothetical protein K2G51_15850 [Lachnospiraceae bacterium]|nr:hypothetical protein [Lachnospiraceae bacterium]MDE7271799.1 hypothetical protein [Lachnospiraceae bacterium]